VSVSYTDRQDLFLWFKAFYFIPNSEKNIMSSEGDAFLHSVTLAEKESTAQAVLRFVRLTEHALPPTRKSPKAAGFDLRSACDCTGQRKELIPTDLKVQLPEGCYGQIASRSGLGLWDHVVVVGGVIDEGYRGSVDMLVSNHSDRPFKISRGDRIAQLICQKTCYPYLEEVAILNVTTW
jgi:dUTP pyrophosphatase